MKKQIEITEAETQEARTVIARNKALELLLSNGRFENTFVASWTVSEYVESQNDVCLFWERLRDKYGAPTGTVMGLDSNKMVLDWEEEEEQPK